MPIDFNKASFKDFENIPGKSIYERAHLHSEFLNFMNANGHMNYRFTGISGCGPTIEIKATKDSRPKTFIGLVSNDYLGFTQHPATKKAAISAIERYGTGAGASPLIGGFYSYLEEIENKISAFFQRPKGSTLVFNTGYASNSSTLQTLLNKDDIAITDMAVHASVFEGLILTNTKRFLHNNLEDLERILKQVAGKYRTVMIIIDGVYSQDGDISNTKAIYDLSKKYNALLLIDDAHGIGVIGKSGRGALEKYDMLGKEDIFITGTFSKTFGSIGGYFVGSPEVISYLQFQSRQNAFSASSSPAIASVSKAIELIDKEPEWQEKLWNNIRYFTSGLTGLGLNVGTTQSAIIPVKIGDPHKTSEAGKLLLDAGIYTNPILYPAVSKKDARIRMSLMATHTKEHLDKALNAFEYIGKKLNFAENKSA